MATLTPSQLQQHIAKVSSSSTNAAKPDHVTVEMGQAAAVAPSTQQDQWVADPAAAMGQSSQGPQQGQWVADPAAAVGQSSQGRQQELVAGLPASSGQGSGGHGQDSRRQHDQAHKPTSRSKDGRRKRNHRHSQQGNSSAPVPLDSRVGEWVAGTKGASLLDQGAPRRSSRGASSSSGSTSRSSRARAVGVDLHGLEEIDFVEADGAGTILELGLHRVISRLALLAVFVAGYSFLTVYCGIIIRLEDGSSKMTAARGRFVTASHAVVAIVGPVVACLCFCWGALTYFCPRVQQPWWMRYTFNLAPVAAHGLFVTLPLTVAVMVTVPVEPGTPSPAYRNHI